MRTNTAPTRHGNVELIQFVSAFRSFSALKPRGDGGQLLNPIASSLSPNGPT
jgi:hypothetical protein